MRKDRYLRARGGIARMLDIFCANCNTWLLRYQKDGIGHLLRCYLNRIFAPPEFAKLQDDPKIREPKDVPSLVCPRCATLMGTPIRHEDGRLAFRLVKGTYAKKTAEGER